MTSEQEDHRLQQARIHSSRHRNKGKKTAYHQKASGIQESLKRDTLISTAIPFK